MQQGTVIPVQFNKGHAVVKSGKATTYYNVKDRNYTRRGMTYEGRIRTGHHVEVQPGEYIRLFGHHEIYDKDNNVVEKDYDITFRVGDEAVYDEYNLIYTGKIVSITAKNVTVKDDQLMDKKRLNFYMFSSYNDNYDEERIARRNAETLQTI